MKRAIWVWALILLLAVVLVGCGEGAEDAASPGSPTPTAGPGSPPPLPPTRVAPVSTGTPGGARPSEGRCGDGVCDGPENAQNCPEDCAGDAAESPEAGPPPAASGPDYEPPINVFLVLHIDPAVDRETNTFQVEPSFYQRTRDEIYWVMGEAERHGLRFTALYNGWYTKWALEHGDTTQFRELVEAGHEIGSHAHRITYDAGRDAWVGRVDELSKYGYPSYDAALARQCWEDADRYMDQVVEEIGAGEQNQTMCAVPFMCSDEGQLMEEFGFSIAAGGRCEKGTSYFGHMVWNPWRPSANDEPGHEIEEDLNAPYITVDHLAQVGREEAHGMDLTVPQLQRRFLMLYAEWLARERSGANDKVWTFGFVVHPNYGDLYNADLVQFLSWLDEHFIGKTSAHGNVIARYASVGEIAAEYEAWEDANPGVSSFSYVRDDPYPYTYELMPIILEGASYEGDVDFGQGVTCFELSKEGHPIYVLWSDLGELTVDLSVKMAGQVRVTNSRGDTSTGDATELNVTEEPLFVEPL
jgi:hypothetical protein